MGLGLHLNLRTHCIGWGLPLIHRLGFALIGHIRDLCIALNWSCTATGHVNLLLRSLDNLFGLLIGTSSIKTGLIRGEIFVNHRSSS